MSWRVNASSAFCVRILQKPELASEIKVEELGKLLPKKILESLEEQYLSKQTVTFMLSREYPFLVLL